jgi:cellulose synthase operon protein YhjQ
MPLVCIASPKGGVGKTTLAANLANALRRDGRRVLAVDFDPQNTLRLHFGLPVTDHAGFAPEVQRRPDWRAFIRQTPSGVQLLPFGALDQRGALSLSAAVAQDPELLAEPMRAILSDPGLVVVADTPPGPSHALSVLVPMSAIVVAVLQAEAISAALVPDITSGRFLGGGTLATLFTARQRVVLNAVDLNSRLSRASADAVARHLGARLLGAVSRDEAVAEALACQKLVQDHAPGCQAAEDIRALARALEGVLPAPVELFPLAWGQR